MKFSFIVPALNEGGYIKDCINSIKNQTASSHEIIVVDNGSKDNTAKIAKELGCKVVKESKRGISYTRNEGANVAQGDILCFVDADGRLSPHWLQEAKKSLSNLNIQAVSGLNVFTHKNTFKKIWYNLYTLVAYTLLLILYFFLGKLFLVGNNLAIRKGAFFQIGGFEPQVAEDYLLSRKFWKLEGAKGEFNRKMTIYYSSRGFDEAGFFKTILYWIKTIVIKTPQEEYSYKHKFKE